MAAAALLAVTAGCDTGGTKHTAAPTAKSVTSAAGPTTPTTSEGSAPPRASAADIALILAMYRDITRAFLRNPDDGVRAIIATQYPGDRADVGFARCVNAIVPGATTLPRSEALRFVPKTSSISPDPGYTVNSSHVHGLHPTGRIYTTVVTITKGTQSTIHLRHQVVRNGKAYQFSAC